MGNQKLSLMDLGKMMHEVFRVFKKRSDEQIDDEIKISTEQFSLLHAITLKEEDVIQKDMAELMGKDKSAILRLIDSLEEKGLVRRVSAIEDRRKNYLMVTKAGYRVRDQYMKIVFELMENIQQGLTQEEIDTFHKVVSHIKGNAEKL
ncbi:MAG: MarR family winged helix-turn-helix transcriptional regulator [Bacteroidia bacterium]|nr:MarR family winged helix-turn-helix transcriptional regulator [Bacteroidia bacterium]